MASFSDVASFKSALLRKALTGAVLVADYSTAFPTDICTSGGTLSPLTGFTSLGKLTNDGVSISDSVERSEIRGWGDTSSPSRIDITSASSSMTVTAMETKKVVWDVFHNTDQTNVKASATTGTITFDKASVPTLRDKRTIFLAQDVNKTTGAPIYFGVGYPRSNISSNGDQTFQNTDATVAYPLTIQALVDDSLGTAVRLWLGGPGVDSTMVAAMGYTTATS